MSLARNSSFPVPIYSRGVSQTSPCDRSKAGNDRKQRKAVRYRHETNAILYVEFEGSQVPGRGYSVFIIRRQPPNRLRAIGLKSVKGRDKNTSRAALRVMVCPRAVRFTPESGRMRCTRQCLAMGQKQTSALSCFDPLSAAASLPH